MASQDTAATAAEIARRYFTTVSERDLDAMLACWAPDGIEIVAGQRIELPDEYRAFFGEIFGAFPDFKLEILDLVAQDDRCVVRYRMRGTFAGPGTFRGLEPNGGRLDIEGADVLQIRDGLVRRNDAYADNMAIAQQLGLLPPAGSPVEARMTKAFNARTKIARRIQVAEPERIAEGVWRVRGGGGLPRKLMNVYFIEHDGKVTMFDAGVKSMANDLSRIGLSLGGIERIVLGHGHVDHRGAAPAMGVPVFCHAADVPIAEGDGGWSEWDPSKLNPLTRFSLTRFLRMWDGGPVEIAGTVAENEEVAGFRVVHIPGHAPGQIALFRESDRLALTTDLFYTLNIDTMLKGAPRIPHAAFTPDREAAIASIRKVAALNPSSAWPGHADPVRGDVRGALERAADAG